MFDGQDEKKILMTCSYMTGGQAKTFARRTQNEVLKDGHTPKRNAWKDFSTHVCHTFRDPRVQEKALEKIQVLKQDKMSIEEYSLQLSMLIDEAEIDTNNNEEWLLSIVKKSIHIHLIRQVYGIQGGPPSNLGEFLGEASKFEELNKQFNEIKGRTLGPAVAQSAPRPAPAPRAPYDPKGYTAEKAGTAPANPGKEFAMSMDQARREGKCKHCLGDYTFGHMCGPKELAQAAHKARLQNGNPTQRRAAEVPSLAEQKDIADAELASLKDKLVSLSRQLALQEKELKGAGI